MRRVHDTREHILFQCHGLCEIRIVLWKDVITNCPKQMVKELEKTNVFDRTKFILNAFNCNFTPEWNNLYASMAKFCHKMYDTYKKDKC